MADSGWDDLFAMAAGTDEQVQNDGFENGSKKNGADDNNNNNNNSSKSLGKRTKNAEHPQKKQQKANKYKKQKKTSNHDHASFTDFLEYRMSPSKTSPPWPTWITLGPSHASECSGWRDSSSSSSKDTTTLEKWICRRCKHSPLSHRLKVADTNDRSWATAIFAAVRNIRCCAVTILSFDTEKACLSLAVKLEADRILAFKSAIQSTLDPGEVSLFFDDKCCHLIQSVTHLDRQVLRNQKGISATRFSLLEAIIRVLIACDAVYYRLYYLQITRSVPDDGSFLIPHPTSYFLVPYLCWDVSRGETFKDTFLQNLSKRFKGASDKDGNTLESALVRYGLTLSPSSIALETNNHPLSMLHYNRLLETLLLFQQTGWASQRQILSKRMLTLPTNDALSCHETPAPELLMEWRDSCRDLLCNLYAYATFAPGGVQRIRATIEKYKIKGGVVELGSGTGYIAKMLKAAGINVVAWDIRPTEQVKVFKATNEYHGCTPPFYNVQRGDVSTLQNFFRISQFKMTKETGAILLSYPPPQCLMAYHALRTYMSAGGECVIHVGEFRGLTGSAEFEDLLLENFRCVDRSPCLCWGTDAAEVSIWLRLLKKSDKREDVPVEQRMLLPCSHCGQRKATKRCRLARYLVYCGENCFRKDTEKRKIDITMTMISSDGGESLDFHNDQHFTSITSLNTRARTTVVNRK